MARALYEVVVPKPGQPRFQIEERDEDGKWVRDVGPGDTVTLDDEVTNIPALIQAGLVRPAERKASAAASKDQAKSEG